MSNDLIPVDLSADMEENPYSLATLDQFSSGSEYFKRIQICGNGQAAAVDAGHAKAGEYIILQGSNFVTNLGNSIDVVPLAARPKALEMGQQTGSGDLLVALDQNSDLFKSIQEGFQSKTRGYLCGLSFLMVERSTGDMFEMFFGSQTESKRSGAVKAYLPVGPKEAKEHGVEPHGPLPCRLKSEGIEYGGNKWYGTKVSDCKAKFSAKQFPFSPEEVAEAKQKFYAMKGHDSKVVKVDDEGGRSRAR